MSSFFFEERNRPPQVMGLFVGVPWPEIIMKTFYIYTGAFWVLAVRLNLGSRKVD